MQFDLFGNPPEQQSTKSKSASKAKATSTAVTRVKIPDPPPPKPAPYGLCRCGEPFLAPGLDASLCPSCGYRVEAQWLSARPQTAKKGGAS